MFSRFTASARRVMQRAFREAKRCQHDFVGTEHLLHGLLCDAEGPTFALLCSLGARPELMIDKVELSLQRHDAEHTMEQFPLSPASRRAFAAALDEAASLHYQLIGPEHLLLGLLLESECDAARILFAHGITVKAVRASLSRISPDARQEAQYSGSLPKLAVPQKVSAAELEDQIMPPQTHDRMTTTPVSILMPLELQTRLRLTQTAFGGFMGYVLGHWSYGPELGAALALAGALVAQMRSVLLCMVCCFFTPAFVVVLAGRLRQEEYILIPVLMGTGAILGSFLGRGYSIHEIQPPANDRDKES